MTSCTYKINHTLQSLKYVKLDKIVDSKSTNNIDNFENCINKLLKLKFLYKKHNENKNHSAIKYTIIKEYNDIVQTNVDTENFLKKIFIELEDIENCIKDSFSETERQEKCYVCDASDEYYCAACNEYFCNDCFNDFHKPYTRQKHAKISNKDFTDRIDDPSFKKFLGGIRLLALHNQNIMGNKYFEKKANDLKVKIYCMVCEKENNLTANYCTKCNKNLNDNKMDRKNENGKTCPKCDKKCLDYENDCKCGYNFNAKDTKTCPTCTFECDIKKNYCPMCDTDLRKK